MAIRRLDGTEYKKVVTKDVDTTAHMTAKGGYTGLENASGSYLRTPVNGLLPNVSGGSGYIGTSGWPFIAGYFNSLYVSGVSQNFRYSTGEQWTGEYWIDGKKIYTKTFSFGQIPGTSDNVQAERTVAHGIANVDTVISMSVKAKATNGNQSSIPSRYTHIWMSQTIFGIRSWSNMSSYTKSYVTVEYTCTNR